MRIFLFAICLIALSSLNSPTFAEENGVSSLFGLSLEFENEDPDAEPTLTGKILGSGNTNQNLIGATVLSVGEFDVNSIENYRTASAILWCMRDDSTSRVPVTIRVTDGSVHTVQASPHIERYPIEENLILDDITESVIARIVVVCLSGYFENVQYDGDTITAVSRSADSSPQHTLRYVVRKSSGGVALGVHINKDRYIDDPILFNNLLDRVEARRPFSKLITYLENGNVDEVFIGVVGIRSDQVLPGIVRDAGLAATDFELEIVRAHSEILECRLRQDADRRRDRPVRHCDF